MNADSLPVSFRRNLAGFPAQICHSVAPAPRHPLSPATTASYTALRPVQPGGVTERPHSAACLWTLWLGFSVPPRPVQRGAVSSSWLHTSSVGTLCARCPMRVRSASCCRGVCLWNAAERRRGGPPRDAIRGAARTCPAGTVVPAVTSDPAATIAPVSTCTPSHRSSPPSATLSPAGPD
jgi:hypothetical protein